MGNQYENAMTIRITQETSRATHFTNAKQNSRQAKTNAVARPMGFPYGASNQKVSARGLRSGERCHPERSASRDSLASLTESSRLGERCQPERIEGSLPSRSRALRWERGVIVSSRAERGILGVPIESSRLGDGCHPERSEGSLASPSRALDLESKDSSPARNDKGAGSE